CARGGNSLLDYW
nr:immunoglobulin heavy chain junction region [Macaca mulatta]MOW89803.1 immunoglobulin heavy chain junction region [Macaca mulatta]MOW89808.1 immunoglobulin heavy chain junction region [Macaca mulatta]MOW92607.1 immunoglobulin heavy chain junction region [Macaca mulatta]